MGDLYSAIMRFLNKYRGRVGQIIFKNDNSTGMEKNLLQISIFILLTSNQNHIFIILA